MKKTLVAMATLALVVGCGGGDDTPDTSGTYQAFTTDGRQFAMKFDFPKLTYSYSVDGSSTQSGALRNIGGETFAMEMAGGGSNTPSLGNFTVADNVIVGTFVPSDGSRQGNPAFIAAKAFVEKLSDVDGMKFEGLTRDVVRSTGASTKPVRWGALKIDAKAGTVSYCKPPATAPVAGAEPLSEPSSCPAGVVTTTLAAQTGGPAGTFGFVEPVSGSSSGSANIVRIAKVGANFVYLAATSSQTASAASFTVALAGTKNDLTGKFVSGWSSVGNGTSLVFGPGANAVRFEGGSITAPGSTSGSGMLTPVAGSNAAWRYTPSGSGSATSGLIMGPGLALLGNLQSANGDMTLFVR